MDPNEDWSGDCKVSDEAHATENEVIQIIPGYASFDAYIQVQFNLP